MPSATAPSHAPIPPGHSRSGRRHVRAASQPAARPARNGHAVEAMPARLSPLVWLARPMTTNVSTQQQSSTTASRTERIGTPYRRALSLGFDDRLEPGAPGRVAERLRDLAKT